MRSGSLRIGRCGPVDTARDDTVKPRSRRLPAGSARLARGAVFALHRPMRSLLALGICLSLSACSMFTRSVERPTATVRTVDVTSAGLTGITGELRLDISNPNAFGVPLSGIDWQ